MCLLISSLLISPSEQTYSAGHQAFISLAGGGGLVAQSCLTLCDPSGLLARQAPLSMGFSRQEYWSGLPCPPPGYHPNPGIKAVSPALAGVFFTTSATWEDLTGFQQFIS